MRIDSLTSLRFCAAAAVLVHHMDFLSKSPSPEVRMVFGWFFEGFAGVQFFYILSGFVIAFSFGSKSFGDFMFFRAARLFPIHWLTLLVATYLYGSLAVHDWESWMRFLTNGALLQSFVPDTTFYFNFNAVSWSISTEMFFYAAFCLFVPLSTRAILFAWALLLLVIVINVLNADMGNTFTGWLLYINPVFRFIDFLTGVLLYRLFIARPLTISYRAATLAEIGSIGLMLLFVVIAMVWQVPIQWRWDIYYIPPITVMIFVFAHDRGLVSQMLSSRLLVLLGDASFALYMVHQMLIAMSPWTPHPESIQSLRGMAQATVFLLVGAVILSIVIHTCFEKPINNLLRRWWISRKTTRIAASEQLSAGHP